MVASSQRQPTLLDFFPRAKKKRFHIGLRSLLLFFSCAGPVALLVSVLPLKFYETPGGAILFMTFVMLIACFVSYARPALLAVIFCSVTVVWVLVGTSALVVEELSEFKSEALPATAGIGMILMVTSGSAYGLSRSRHAE